MSLPSAATTAATNTVFKALTGYRWIGPKGGQNKVTHAQAQTIAVDALKAGLPAITAQITATAQLAAAKKVPPTVQAVIDAAYPQLIGKAAVGARRPVKFVRVTWWRKVGWAARYWAHLGRA